MAQKKPKLAKSKDPNFRQASAWIRRDTDIRVRTRLLKEGGEYSDLIQRLLEDWLKPR